MQGVIPGPQLFTNDRFWINSIMLGLILVNLLMWLQGKIFIKFFSQVTRIPNVLLITMLINLCVAGVFAANNASVDIYLMLIFGFCGYWLIRFDFPPSPLIIAMVLGPLAEQNMRKAPLISDGDPSTFFTRAISCAFLGISLAVIGFAARKAFRCSK